jgi:solute carrier family 25 protein 34/35
MTSTQSSQQQQVTLSQSILAQGKNFLLGGIATSTAVFFTNPFDTVKSRLQIQAELAKSTKENTHYKGVVDALVKIAKNEGFGLQGLQKGLGPAIAYQFVMNGTRLGSYSVLNYVTTDPEDGQTIKFVKKLFCGGTAGVMGACLGSPLFLVKTRMQVQSNAISVGEQYRYNNMFSALREIYKSGGFGGLYTGVRAAALRVAMGSSVQLATYDTTKNAIVKFAGLSDDQVLTHLYASFMCSIVVCLVMNPFDVISTRLYMQRSGDQQKYTGVLDCLVKTLKTEGPRGAYKGALAQYSRIAPHTVLTFIFWEQLKRMF